jgi:hypothetical protein
VVLETFKVQLHHLTPNGILTLSKFCYACETYGTPSIWTLSMLIMSSSTSQRRRRLMGWRLSTSLQVAPLWRRGRRRMVAWKYLSPRKISGRRTRLGISFMDKPLVLPPRLSLRSRSTLLLPLRGR